MHTYILLSLRYVETPSGSCRPCASWTTQLWTVPLLRGGFRFLSKWLDIVGIRREVQKSVSETLESSTYQIEGQHITFDLNVH